MKFHHSFQLSKLDKKKGLKLPEEISEEFAEFLGIHLGDGSMSKDYRYTYKVTYACNSVEVQYAQHITDLFERLFGVRLRVIRDDKRHCVNLYYYSKTLCEFLNLVVGIPYGKKIDIRIPPLVMSNAKYATAFIRGVFDTDGCITTQRDKGYKYILAKICTKHKTFADDLHHTLLSLNIPAFACVKSGRNFFGYDVTIRNKNVIKFFEIVGSNNQKNIEKWGRRDLNPDPLL